MSSWTRDLQEGSQPSSADRGESAPLRVAVVVHLYYHHLWPEFAALIRNVPAPFKLFVTVPHNSPAEAAVKADFPDADVRYVANVGRDVAPFLALLPELQAYDVVCKVQTKRDTQIHRQWRIASLRGVLGSRTLVERLLSAFADRPQLMMAGARDLYLDGALNVAANEDLLGARSDVLPDTYGFFAGTIFWVRPSALIGFVAEYPQSVFVEHQDFDGHPEHALERLFGARVAELGGHVAVTSFDGAEPVIEVQEKPRGLRDEWSSIVNDRLLGKYESYPRDWYLSDKQPTPGPVGVAPSFSELFAAHEGLVSDKWASYFPHYDRLLAPYREALVSVLEIGVQNGGFLEILARYFPNGGAFVGNDIDPRCADLKFDDPRIHVVIGDMTDPTVAHRVRRAARLYDIVIDDGSHRSGDIVRAFAQQFSKIRDGGLFIAEDLHASYWREYDGGLDHPHSAMAFFKALVDIVNHEHWGTGADARSRLATHLRVHDAKIGNATLAHVHSVEFVNSMCIVRKRPPGENLLGPRRGAGRVASVAPVSDMLPGTTSNAPPQDNRWARSGEPLLVRIARRLDGSLGPLKRLLRRR